MVFHDTDLRRIANDPRRIAHITLAQLREIDARAWFNPSFAGERIPTLDEAVVAAQGGAMESSKAANEASPGASCVNSTSAGQSPTLRS